MPSQEILAIDLSSSHSYLSWASMNSEYRILYSESHIINPQMHPETNNRSKTIIKNNVHLVEKIEEIRKKCCGEYNNIGLIIINLGPGSFTGLRISLAFARGLQAGLEKLLIIGIDSMRLWKESLIASLQAQRSDPLVEHTIPDILVVHDARSNKFFTQLFVTQHESDIRELNERELQDYIGQYKNRHTHRTHAPLYIVGTGSTQLEKSFSYFNIPDPQFVCPQIDAMTIASTLLHIGIEDFKRKKNILSDEDVPSYIRGAV